MFDELTEEENKALTMSNCYESAGKCWALLLEGSDTEKEFISEIKTFFNTDEHVIKTARVFWHGAQYLLNKSAEK